MTRSRPWPRPARRTVADPGPGLRRTALGRGRGADGAPGRPHPTTDRGRRSHHRGPRSGDRRARPRPINDVGPDPPLPRRRACGPARREATRRSGLHRARGRSAAQHELPARASIPLPRGPDCDGLTPHELAHGRQPRVAAGANVKAVQQMLGHASAAMTWTCTPASSSEDDLDAVADRLGRAFAKRKRSATCQMRTKRRTKPVRPGP